MRHVLDGRRRVLVPVLATLVLLAPVAWLWFASLVPSRYSVLQMGAADYGGGPGSFAHDHSPGAGQPQLAVDQLVADPARPADVRVDADRRTGDLAVRRQGGARLHAERHLPRADDPRGAGPAGRGAPAQRRRQRRGRAALARRRRPERDGRHDRRHAGRRRCPAGTSSTASWSDDAGTYWYHSHQLAVEQVAGGLFGAIVVAPKTPVPQQVDALAVSHTYAGVRTLDGQAGDAHVAARPGQTVRVRVVNTDSGLIQTWASTPYAVLAVDGHDVNRPTAVSDQAVTVTAGGRVDLGVTMPADGSAVRVQVSKGLAVVLGRKAPRTRRRRRSPAARVDLLTYGSPAPLGFDPAPATRHFQYSIGHRPGFVDGKPGPVVVGERAALPAHPDDDGERGRRGRHAPGEPQRRRAPDAPARAPRGRARPQRRRRDRQPVVVRLAERRRRRELRRGLRRRQPRACGWTTATT